MPRGYPHLPPAWEAHYTLGVTRFRSRAPLPDVISIEGLSVDCVVGVYPHERTEPQPLRVDLQIALDTAHALTRYLLAPPALGEDRPRLQEVTLRLTKPMALGGNGVPSLEVTRTAADVKLGLETKPFGTVDVVHETRSEGIYRLNVAPGRSIPLHVHRVMNESEMILGDGLLLNGRSTVAGEVYRWAHDVKHRYDNPTDRWRSILCVDSPPFLPGDEVEVDGEHGEVTPEAPFLPLSPVVVAP